MQHFGEQLGGLLLVGIAASPARTCRRRRLLTSAAALLVCSLEVTGVEGAARAVPPCSTPGTSWCRARRIVGTVRAGELGFRFGEPLDVDGDGRADVAAGARFKPSRGMQQNGSAAVWSGASGALIRAWDGEWPAGLFGHWVMPVPDVSGDGLADLVIAAPDARDRGILVARSPKTGKQLWQRVETESENLGWDLALAGDQDGDGRTDLFVGAPSEPIGRVYLLSGRDGTVLRTYAPQTAAESFGWYVAELDDLDGNGRRDLVVGGTAAAAADGRRVGGAWVLSAESGKELHHWTGEDPRGGFGHVVAAVADIDGDGKSEVAVAAPGTEDQARTLPGELRIYSSATGEELRRWSGTQPGELYGRMIADAGDLDGDGVPEVAVGAPWHRSAAGDQVGRMELRSPRTGALLAELFGDGPDCWFGWHIRRAPDPTGRGRPALLVSSLRHPVDGRVGVGVMDVLVLRSAGKVPAHGTTTRDVRRSDIR